MKCNKFEELLYLQDELNLEETNLLDKHLKDCSECQQLKQEIEQSSLIINNLSAVDPIFEYPKILTNQILENIETRSKFNISTYFLKIIDLFFSPKVRYALGTIAFLLVLTFVFQQSVIMYRLSNLEQKITETSVNNYQLQTNKQNNSFRVSLQNRETIEIDKKDLEILLESYKELNDRHDALIRLIEKKYPELANDMPNKYELRKIISNKKELSKIINEL